MNRRTELERRVPRLARIICLCSLLCSSAFAEESGRLVITSLNGGERIAAGSDIAITWRAEEALAGTMDIAVWDGLSNRWHTIATGIPARSERFTWRVPEEMKGDRFRLKIASTASPDRYWMGETFFSIDEPARRTSGIATDRLSIGAGVVVRAMPNPMESSTTITFTLSESTPITLGIYDARGTLIDDLVAGATYAPGMHHVTWSGTHGDNEPVGNGTYFYRLTTSVETVTGQIVVVR